MTMALPPASLDLAPALLLSQPDGVDRFLETLAPLTPPARAPNNPAAALVEHLPSDAVLPALQRLAALDPLWIRVEPDNRRTLMTAAAHCGRLDLLRWALDQGLAPEEGGSAITWAMSMAPAADRDASEEAVVRALLDTGRYSDLAKSGAVARAAGNRSLGGLRALLDHGARVTLVPSSVMPRGLTFGKESLDINPLTMVVFGSSRPESAKAVLAMLLSEGRAKALLDHGWNDQTPQSALHTAARYAAAWAIPLLVDAGASMNRPAWMAEDSVDTPLMVAAWENNLAEVHALLRAGADTSLLDSNGCSALHLLAETNLRKEPGEDAAFAACTQALIDAGADPLLRNAKGQSPLDLAEGKAKAGMSRVLRAICLEISLAPGTAGRRGPRL